ncbi:hypothetical protein EMPS_09457 [Entomortierella parvispora]|uniref:Uncharacterized protein n=1 Tax=Entomortierella parvispora TaxID=205924 RepID=A0A9P3HID3_9FUNG|nr:hypothetical protein EMPS_09457 [Entomortierella parvispora]
MFSAWLQCLALMVLALIPTLPLTNAHMAMLFPPPRGGWGTAQFDWKIHTFIGYNGFKFPCGGYKKGKVTPMKAGDIIPVRFWTSDMTYSQHITELPKKSYNEARHGGGLCEFSLSYDGGKSFRVIATYTKTCPDVLFKWPVRIPDNVPSCKKSGECLFSWSWTSALVPQYYHNCADVTIEGKANGRLPSKKMQVYNFKGYKQKTFPGDGRSHSPGSGPIKSEIVANTRKWI